LKTVFVLFCLRKRDTDLDCLTQNNVLSVKFKFVADSCDCNVEMVKPLFSQCCGCFSLINGTILFGCFSLVSSFYSVLVIGYRLFYGLNNVDVNFPPNLPDLELTVLKTCKNVYLKNFTNKVLIFRPSIQDQTEILAFLIVSSILSVPLSALLIWGAKKVRDK
jgi:hypothetical protein